MGPHTLSEQGKLPRLPIPALNQTVDRYLESVGPLLAGDKAALAETQRRASAFLKVADRLQQRLVSYDATQESSWLEAWWLELAYLSWREGLCINSNYWLTIADDPNAYGLATAPKPLLPSDEGYSAGKVWESNEYSEFQVRRAVRFIQRTLDFKELVDEGRLPIDRTKAGPQCMRQYTCIFGMTRIPRMGCDQLRQDKTTMSSRTIILILKDQLYSVDVYDSAGHRKPNGDLESELHTIIADVVMRADQGELDPAIPVLTAGHRDRWSAAYAELEKQPANHATLAAIQEALFAVSLDTTYSDPFGSINAHQQNMKCHGTEPGHNRWYDKCASYIVDRNGTVGYVGEHSPCDALIPAFMIEHVSKAVAGERIERGLLIPETPSYQPHVRRLRFTDVGASVLDMVREAEAEVGRAASESCSRQIRFEGFGSEWIKKGAAIGPDAFAQMALQLTYYRMHGEFAPVYETASTRQFLHGRTETVRSLTSEGAEFMRAMCDPTSTVLGRYQALVRAAKKHQTMLRNASSGQGVDRHILGLRMAYLRVAPLPGESAMSEQEKRAIDEFFGDPALARSTTFQLSTSGLFPSYYLTHTGFGCVAPERAYGTNYIIESKRIKFGIEGKTRDAGKGTDVELFEATLRQTLWELKLVCEQANSGSAGKHSHL
ncbi:hypothetical protein IWW55_000877 [Coemansia sp. RSA 2706]|nr:hypothetical protein IWW55_000877 [Coemansia sp. RSA 2706]KAJ2308895.1 hypothetical protein IWW54_003956 [Coemansia sp. RSA 2705]KAJ2317678.1 hypothetical protein IWW52_002994 [Coemansia sp. RSA 2704]KAJ2383023.1 hypothetical protein H4S02_005483 [Coemansia sp. RSA 2611]